MKQHTHIGVYALAKIGDSMIFIKKARGPYTGKWDLPGGSFEFGETPLETLHREFNEETELDFSKSKLLDVLSHTGTYKNTKEEDVTVHHIGIIYSIEIKPNDKKLKTDSNGEDSLGAAKLKISSVNKNNFAPFAYQSIDFACISCIMN